MVGHDWKDRHSGVTSASLCRANIQAVNKDRGCLAFSASSASFRILSNAASCSSTITSPTTASRVETMLEATGLGSSLEDCALGGYCSTTESRDLEAWRLSVGRATAGRNEDPASIVEARILRRRSEDACVFVAETGEIPADGIPSDPSENDRKFDEGPTSRVLGRRIRPWGEVDLLTVGVLLLFVLGV